MEFETEIDICVPNAEIKEMFCRCVNQGKNVIAISDMYLPREQIERILKHCGFYGLKKIYVSCECKADKRSGTLFNFALDDLNIRAGELLHIGDNRKSDYFRAKLLGIHSYLYRYRNKNIQYSEKNSDASYRNQQAFLKHITDLKYSENMKNLAFKIGYCSLGPLLYGFSRWLENKFDEDNIEKVFFLSRDGKIMEQALSLYGTKYSHNYFYASRRALIVPTLWCHSNYEDTMRLFFTADGDTVRSLLWKLGLEPEKYRDIMIKYNLNLDSYVFSEKENEKAFSLLFNEIKSDIDKNSKVQFELLKKYMISSEVKGRVAIVDIGWYGNMQRAIDEVINVCGIDADIKGYYLGIIPSSKTVSLNRLDVRGFLFENGRGELRRYEKSMNAFIEFVFSATHGTVVAYEQTSDEEDVTPILGKYEFDVSKGISEESSEKIILTQIQDAALKYISDTKEHVFFAEQDFSPECCFRNIYKMCVNPNKKELEFIGNIRIETASGKFRYMATPQKKLYYFVHPNSLKNDLKYSGWRIGFLKKLVKLPLPYARIYFGIRKLMHVED